MTIWNDLQAIAKQSVCAAMREHAGTAAKLGLLILFVTLTNTGLWQAKDIISQSAFPALAGLFLILTWIGFGIVCLIVAWDPSPKVRLSWGALLALSALLFTAVRTLVGAPVSFQDAQMYWAMRADTDAALQSFWTAMLPALALGGLGLFAILLPPHVPRRLAHRVKWRRLRWAPVLPVLIYAAGIAWDGGKMTAAFPSQYKLASFLPMVTARDWFDTWPERRDIDMAPRPSSASLHILYIVDESLRADFIDINKASGTTPFLLSRRNDISNFGYASSAHNCSDQSNAILRWGVTLNTLQTARTQPTLWRYAKAAGYTSTYIDVQKRDGILQNYMRDSEKAEIDAFIAYDTLTPDGADLPKYKKDRVAADLVADILKRPEPQLIYFNKEGIHFPYEGKYPREATLFDNHMDGPFEPIGESKERLINSYKNAVHWSVDQFLAALLPQVDLERTLMIYTSDHGQNLLDRGLSTHCRVVNPHFMEGLVPLFVMTQTKTWKSAFDAGAAYNKDKASHFQIFPSLLTVMGFEPNQIQARYGETLFEPISTERKFASGFIFDDAVAWEWTHLPDDLKSRPWAGAQAAARPQNPKSGLPIN